MARPLKLVLVGNGSVGKTSIINRFVQDGFVRVYKQTVGIDFFQKTMRLRADTLVALQVWDIGGQSIQSDMLDGYITGADVVCVCYDVTDRRSFDDAEDWLRRVRKALARKDKGAASGGGASAEAVSSAAVATAVSSTAAAASSAKEDGGPSVATSAASASSAPPSVSAHIYLVGNKIDLAHLRRVPETDHQRFVQREGLQGGFFVSAQSGDAVTRSFVVAAARAVGVELSEYELSFHDRVLSVTIASDMLVGGHAGEADSRGEDRAVAEMLREDEEAEARRLKMVEEARRKEREGASGGCGCVVM